MAEVEAEEAVAEEVFEVEAEVEEEAVLETGIKIKVPLKLLKRSGSTSTPVKTTSSVSAP